MVNLTNIQKNHLLYISNKGVVTQIFSKVAFLIFGIVITLALFLVLDVQQNFYELSEEKENLVGVRNVIDFVNINPFNIELENVKFTGNIKIENENLILTYGNKKIKTNLRTLKINTSDFKDCIDIKKTKEMVITQCS